jgi:hypothetical protein
MRQGGDDAQLAAYRRARLLTRLRPAAEGDAALAAFAEYPVSRCRPAARSRSSPRSRLGTHGAGLSVAKGDVCKQGPARTRATCPGGRRYRIGDSVVPSRSGCGRSPG